MRPGSIAGDVSSPADLRIHVTDTASTVPPTRIAPPPPGWQAGRAAPTGSTRLATASLVLGIVAVVFDLLLVPTVLAIVFGAIALARGTGARTRAIVGMVLGVVGVLVACVVAAIAIPVYLGVQHAAIAHVVEAGISEDASAQGLTFTDVACPTPRVVEAGAKLLCTARATGIGPVTLDVTFHDSRGGFTYRAARG